MSLLLKSVLLVSIALATAFTSVGHRSQKTCHLCDVSFAEINLTGTKLPAPSFPPMFIGLGMGTQNYTCQENGTFVNVGALAELFDISCLYGTRGFEDLPSAAFKAWNNSVNTNVFDSLAVISHHVLKFPFTLGQHYYTTNPVTGSGLTPKWDFTSATFAGDSAAFVVGNKTDDVPAPINSAVNIDWVYLTNLTGTLANEIYRVDTQGGQPPTSCIPGSPEIFVKYTTVYWFTGGSF
ncbi:putative malate dehydrogenase [Gymnopus androsaceus JB14]|uniref:Malate dehydrogenase n=1 Tax=Gymnopus androsaceus JB14 TaxID=1447944 RepID=A0A6A4I3X9_9AGAR|nr:putative malate dehydrogenase [Gymnopus androsaceus JB14]